MEYNSMVIITVRLTDQSPHYTEPKSKEFTATQ